MTINQDQLNSLYSSYDQFIKNFDEFNNKLANNSSADITTTVALKNLNDIKENLNKINSDAKELINKLREQNNPEITKKLTEIQQNCLSVVNDISSKEISLKSQDIYDEAFRDFPKEEMFRMFIDTDRQHEGEDTFDVKEPGYKKAMSNVFNGYIRNHLGERLTAQKFIQLHDFCIDQVCDDKGASFEKGLASGQSYGLKETDSRKISKKAKQEWEDEKLILMMHNIFKKFSSVVSEEIRNDLMEKEVNLYLSGLAYGNQVMNNSISQEDTLNKLDNLFDTYYKSIEIAKTSDEKLQAIARLCRALEIFHVFSDGNQRTIAFALLNKLVIENRVTEKSFSPVILDDPYVFDGYHSVEELVQDIEKGMQNFRSHRKSNQ